MAPGAVVVGTGFGSRVHVPALRAAGFTVEALVGTDPDRTARRADRLGIPNALTSFDAALGLSGVVAVTIATPPHSHARLSIDALRAEKHVVCEKPFALDIAEAAAMLEEAEGRGAGPGHQRRHHRRAAVRVARPVHAPRRRSRRRDAGVVVRARGGRRLARRARLSR